MLKHDKVFDLKRFLGITKDQAENPPQQWAETSGQQSEPIFVTENPSGLSQDRAKSSMKKHKKTGG